MPNELRTDQNAFEAVQQALNNIRWVTTPIEGNLIVEEDIVSSNSNNKNRKVKLYTGETVNIIDAIQTLCGRWFKKTDTENVVKCYFSETLLFKMVAVKIHYDFINGIPQKVAYCSDKYMHNLVYIYMPKISADVVTEGYAIYKEIPLEFYKECVEQGCFYHTSIYPKKPIQSKYRKVNAIKRGEYLTTLEQYRYGIKSPTFNRTEGKRYSFGLELETSLGILPEYLDTELSYEAVHDGSLRDGNGEVWGAEYVTGILTGDTGFLQARRLLHELNKRCAVNQKCGMHIHLGLENKGSFNKLLTVTLYKLLLMVEKEMFSFLPVSRRNNEYCRPLPKVSYHLMAGDAFDSSFNDYIDIIYTDIIKEISSSRSSVLPLSINKKNDHPMGHKCGYNHSSARYCWVNFVPALFDTRGNGVYTIEFRSHSGTTLYEKVKNWLLLCMGLLWYAENYTKEILLAEEISVNSVLRKAYPKFGEKIIKYLEDRKAKFTGNSVTEMLDKELQDYEERNEPHEKLSLKNL